jgi:citronellol/citronellal dehydrogenase
VTAVLVTGAASGIGRATALRAARDGANIAIVAKTIEPHPRLPGTIYTAANEIERAGGRALPIPCDIQHDEQVAEAVKRTVDTFGGIDILVNNASAIHLAGTSATPMKRFDLMHRVNTRGTFLCSQLCIPFLQKAANPHILTLSPPLSMEARWFAPHVAYTISKFGMSMCVLGMAEELRPAGIAVNALWPRTVIATAAISNLLGREEMVARSRKPEIVGDAAHWILTRPSREFTGNFCIDDETLAKAGVTDLSAYSVRAGAALVPDLFV